MPFFDAAFPLFGQLPEYRTEMSLQVPIQRPPAVDPRKKQTSTATPAKPGELLSCTWGQRIITHNTFTGDQREDAITVGGEPSAYLPGL